MNVPVALPWRHRNAVPAAIPEAVPKAAPAAVDTYLTRPDVAAFRLKRPFFHAHKVLQPLKAHGKRSRDDRTVIVLELDNFGDLGANLPAGTAALPPSLIALLAAGGVACFWFGTRPALQDIVDGSRNVKLLHEEQSRLRKKYRRLLAELIHSSAPPTLTQQQWQELQNLAVRLQISQDESISDKIERIISGLLAAPASVITGIGTFMTPGFIAHGTGTVAVVANLFTGWVPAGPVAAYGVLNAASSVRDYCRARSRLACLEKYDLNTVWNDNEVDLQAFVGERQRLMRNNAVLTGVASVGVAVGGVVTAFSLAGYAVLLPFAVMRALAEYREAKKIGYVRQLYDGAADYSSDADLLNDLLYACKIYRELKSLKRATRARYPWGAQAPLPFNWVIKASAAVHPQGDKDATPPPAIRLRRFFTTYRRIEMEWMQRKRATLVGDRQELEAAIVANPTVTELPLHLRLCNQAIAAIDAQLQALPFDAAQVAQDSLASMYGSQAHDWAVRIVSFFVQAGLFRKLAAELYGNDILKPSLGRGLQEGLGKGHVPGKPDVVIDANEYIAELERLHYETLSHRRFVDALFEACERRLLIEVKRYYEEMQRELADLVITRLVLRRSPERNPARRLTPSPDATEPLPPPEPVGTLPHLLLERPLPETAEPAAPVALVAPGVETVPVASTTVSKLVFLQPAVAVHIRQPQQGMGLLQRL